MCIRVSSGDFILRGEKNNIMFRIWPESNVSDTSNSVRHTFLLVLLICYKVAPIVFPIKDDRIYTVMWVRFWIQRCDKSPLVKTNFLAWQFLFYSQPDTKVHPTKNKNELHRCFLLNFRSKKWKLKCIKSKLSLCLRILPKPHTSMWPTWFPTILFLRQYN